LTGTVISVILALFWLNASFGQSYKKTNLEILEQNISGELEKFFYYPDLNRNFQFVFFVTSSKNDKTEKKFIESVIKKTAGSNNLKISFAKDEQMLSGDSVYNKVRIDIQKLRTTYPRFEKNKFLGEKTMEREIISKLGIGIQSSDEEVKINDRISTNYKDEIPYDDYEQYENEEYSFAQSLPPNVSWFETIFFPALIVTVSAVATILFFTIRSK